jgi:hypothetical protein
MLNNQSVTVIYDIYIYIYAIPPRFEDLHARAQGCYIQPSQNNAKHRFFGGLAIWYPPKKKRMVSIRLDNQISCKRLEMRANA